VAHRWVSGVLRTHYTTSRGNSLTGDHGAPELSSFFPPFLWLLRDFVVELQDSDGKPLDPNAYMERALEPRLV